MRSALQEALDQLGRVIVETFQAPPARIKIYLREGEKPILNVALAPSLYLDAHSRSDESHRKEEEDAKEGKVSPCVLDILEVLRKAKKPLTTLGILESLAKEEKEWSQSWVGKFLAEMVRDGILINPKGAKPPGYRLAEWERTSDDEHASA